MNNRVRRYGARPVGRARRTVGATIRACSPTCSGTCRRPRSPSPTTRRGSARSTTGCVRAPRPGSGRPRPSRSARCHGWAAPPATRTGTWSRTSRRSGRSTAPRSRSPKAPHDAAAAAARAGVAGVMAHVAGPLLPARPGWAAWLRKPAGVAYDAFHAELADALDGEASAWQRQMTLGPGERVLRARGRRAGAAVAGRPGLAAADRRRSLAAELPLDPGAQVAEHARAVGLALVEDLVVEVVVGVHRADARAQRRRELARAAGATSASSTAYSSSVGTVSRGACTRTAAPASAMKPNMRGVMRSCTSGSSR